MRSIVLVTLCSLLLAGCGSTANQTETTASANTNAESTKVCKDKPAQVGSRLAKKVCK
jgi:uncharacterized protein YceK